MTAKSKTKPAKKRFHVSLPNSREEMLVKLAEKEGIPPATMAANLLGEALERYEDQFWAKEIEKRMNEPDIKWMSLEEVEAELGLDK